MWIKLRFFIIFHLYGATWEQFLQKNNGICSNNTLFLSELGRGESHMCIWADTYGSHCETLWVFSCCYLPFISDTLDLSHIKHTDKEQATNALLQISRFSSGNNQSATGKTLSLCKAQHRTWLYILAILLILSLLFVRWLATIRKLSQTPWTHLGFPFESALAHLQRHSAFTDSASKTKTVESSCYEKSTRLQQGPSIWWKVLSVLLAQLSSQHAT